MGILIHPRGHPSQPQQHIHGALWLYVCSYHHADSHLTASPWSVGFYGINFPDAQNANYANYLLGDPGTPGGPGQPTTTTTTTGPIATVRFDEYLSP